MDHVSVESLTIIIIAGDFQGSKYSWFSNISQFVVYIIIRGAACTAGSIIRG